MKFITSTDLKRWADTKECQQFLPELIKKLIDASVSNINRLTFPAGDAVSVHGWDGIVSCEEGFDIIPAGISLWECGATKDVSGKISHDFGVREEDPLGYTKSSSTFVLVTPRIWEGSDEWQRTHQSDWKKVVVYTAVELERWIDNHPSVGIWLAQKIRRLPSGGFTLPELFWEKWAQSDKYELPYGILLHGREAAKMRVIEACTSKSPLILQTLTYGEGIAFSIATLMTCKESDKLVDRTIVVTKKKAYEELVEHYDNLIILTTFAEGVHYATKRGHTIIVVTTPADCIKDAVKLPIIEKEGFVRSVVEMGINVAKAEKYAKDTARDINVFRRRLGIAIEKPHWGNAITELLPAILIGKWNDSYKGDKEIIERISGKTYEQFELILSQYIGTEESPILHIAHLWLIRSPYEAIDYAINLKAIPSTLFDAFRAICLDFINDEDPEAIEKIEREEFHLHKNNRKYSTSIKEGVFQNLCLFSILDNSGNRELSQWVDETISLMLKDWDFTRYLSNNHFLTSLAEASPKCFLSFVENLPQILLDKVFLPRQRTLSLSGWEILYTELLWALEMLAWDAEYLYRVTRLLLQFAAYKNESNYENRPTNSLSHIYRFYLPQTYVSFEERMTIIKSLAPRNRKTIFCLCKMVCESIEAHSLVPNSHYKWRLFGSLEFPSSVKLATSAELKEVINIMLQCCDYSAKSIAEFITLSAKSFIGENRMLIIDSIKDYISDVEETSIVTGALREIITRHKQYEGEVWALTKDELEPYEKILSDITPKDALHKYTWMFEDTYVQLPHKWEHDYHKEYEEQEKARIKALNEVIEECGTSGLWDFIQLVKCPESLSNSIVAIFGNTLSDEIYKKYKTKEISEEFFKSYLFSLCRKNPVTYQGWASSIVSTEKDMAIVLYSPGYNKELAHIAEKTDNATKKRYWENVQVNTWTKEDTESVVKELINVSRYSEAIEIICSNRTSLQISDLEIVEILYGYISNSSVRSRHIDLYYITSILEELDKSEDPRVIKPLLFVEFVLIQQLEHRMNTNHMRLSKELSRNPELLIQLVELAYLPDDGNIEQSGGVPSKNRRIMAENASYILHHGHSMVSFNDEDGVFDGDFMKQYIERLYALAEERRRTKVIDYIVGEILGGVLRNENYPPQALCKILEELNNDNIDGAIRCRIYNSRGVCVRAYNEGGDQERAIVSKFERYKERTKLLYPRITRIFDSLIKDYKREAGELDDAAQITDLEY